MSTQISKEFKKKALRLSKTFKLVYPLIDLQSVMEKQYWNSYHCCREIHQEGVYLRFKYCNKRWCFECNAIRAAKMINGYKPVFEKFSNKQFVTLTRPNVKSMDLDGEVRSMIKTFTLCVRHLREKKKIDIKGLRKIEVTYNWILNSYHPHFHLIIDSLPSARAIIKEWLFRNPDAVEDAQNIRKADASSFIELFKYAVKAIAEDDMSLYAKDIIFQALSGLRIYQPFGIKKCVSEDVEDIITQAYGSLEPDTYKVWRYDDEFLDWFTNEGVSLIETFDTS